MTPASAGHWEGGEAYERYMGRWSRVLALEVVRWLGVAPDQRWLDVGCGTGALTSAILELASPASVLGIEPSETFLSVARERVPDSRATFMLGDAAALPLPDGVADVAASCLVLNFLPDPETAMREMARVARPGGLVVAVLWDYGEGMKFLRHFWDAATSLEPEARHLDEGVRFPLCRPEPLERLFASVGLERVRLNVLDIPTRFTDFMDFWQPFLDGPGPAPGYAASLSEAQREALRVSLVGRLPTAVDGAIDLTARAWAVSGQRTPG